MTTKQTLTGAKATLKIRSISKRASKTILKVLLGLSTILKIVPL